MTDDENYQCEMEGLKYRIRQQEETILSLERKVSDLEKPARFGWQCYQDHCENAYVEASVVKRIDEQLVVARAAIVFVKEFFQKLEDGTEDGDPLKEMRRKYHAPVHAKLDAALAKFMEATHASEKKS